MKSKPDSSRSFRKAPSRFSYRRIGVSNSMIFPASRTIILSLSRMVLSRCATVRTVQSANCERIVDWMRLSVLYDLYSVKVIKEKEIFSKEMKKKMRKKLFRTRKKKSITYSGSTFAVASSSIKILFFLSIARAKQSNCL